MKRIDDEHRRYVLPLSERFVFPQVYHVIELATVHGSLGEDLCQSHHVAETQIHALTGQGMDSMRRVP